MAQGRKRAANLALASLDQREGKRGALRFSVEARPAHLGWRRSPVFEIDTGPLAEILQKIKSRTDYGEPATGSYLTTQFAKDP